MKAQSNVQLRPNGSNFGKYSATYGTLGSSGVDVIFGARTSLGAWIDSLNHIWVFGGSGLDSAGVSGPLNDLFRFDPYTAPLADRNRPLIGRLVLRHPWLPGHSWTEYIWGKRFLSSSDCHDEWA